MKDRMPLTARLAGGEPEAFAEVYDRFGVGLFAYLRAFVGDRQEAEDLLQAVMLRVVRHRARLPAVEHLKAFLYTMARNEALRRGRRRRLPNAGATALEGLAHPARAAADTEALRRALAALAPERFEVVTLHLHHGLTFRELADLLSIPPNTAASRYRRALADLRRLLETADVER